MNDKLLFLTKDQKEKLKKAFFLVESVKNEMSLLHEEYTIINTSLYNLKKAIEYQEKYY
jgi:hypothetical protein